MSDSTSPDTALLDTLRTWWSTNTKEEQATDKLKHINNGLQLGEYMYFIRLLNTDNNPTMTISARLSDDSPEIVVVNIPITETDTTKIEEDLNDKLLIKTGGKRKSRRNRSGKKSRKANRRR